MANTALLKPTSVEVQVAENNPNRAVITLEPFERGYGHTLGNALRRILLSSMIGFAPTEAQITGVVHEYSQIDGVLEDVVDILLNLKGVVFKLEGRDEVTVMLRKQAVNEAGGYLDWYCDEDYYLWLRLFLAGGSFANVPETLVMVRVSEEMYARRGGWKYFQSEARLQKYMYRQRIITFPLYCVNVMKRVIVQLLLPNKLRGWVFRRLARE